MTGQRNWFGSVGAIVARKTYTSMKTMTRASDEDVDDDSSLSSNHYCWFLVTEGPRRADRENPIPSFPLLSVNFLK